MSKICRDYNADKQLLPCLYGDAADQQGPSESLLGVLAASYRQAMSLHLQQHTEESQHSNCSTIQADHITPTAHVECQQAMLLIRSTPVLAMCQFLFNGETALAALSALIMRSQNLLTSILCMPYTHVASAKSFSD